MRRRFALDCGGFTACRPSMLARRRQGLCSFARDPRPDPAHLCGRSFAKTRIGWSIGNRRSAAGVAGARELSPMPSAHGQHDAPIAIAAQGWLPRLCARCWRNRSGVDEEWVARARAGPRRRTGAVVPAGGAEVRRSHSAPAGRALEDVADAGRLAEVGDWIIECGTATDLLGRVSEERRRGV